MESGAKFSECGKYRFWLSRVWDSSLPQLMLIGLNPSTANATNDDPTIRRIIKLAENNGYGAIWMTNLFAFITPYPEQLRYDTDDLKRNDFVLKATRIDCHDVCFCWGNFKVEKRALEVAAMFPDALCFGKNKNGSPKHPLYLKSETNLIRF